MRWNFAKLLTIRCGLICAVVSGGLETSRPSSAGERSRTWNFTSRRLPTRIPLLATSSDNSANVEELAEIDLWASDADLIEAIRNAVGRPFDNH